MERNKRIRIAALMALFLIVLAVGIVAIMPAHQVHAAEGTRATTEVKAYPTEFLNGKKYLDGSQMQLLSSSGEVLEEWTSSADGPHIIEYPLILDETYVLHQVTAPDGYTQEYEADEDLGIPAGSFDVNYTIGYDTTFYLTADAEGKETVHYSYYRYLFRNNYGEKVFRGVFEDKSSDQVMVIDYRSRTMEIGKEVLGNAGDTEEYFEIILEIPRGIPGQIMKVDLSNADSSKNPATITIPEDGVLKASFWLKDGQSIKLDGFPLYGGDYYTVSENNETLNAEGYITRILAAETMDQVESDSLIIQGINLISKNEPSNSSPVVVACSNGILDRFLGWIPAQEVYAAGESTDQESTIQYEVTEKAIENMSDYATEDMFTVEDPVVEIEGIRNPLLETLGFVHEYGYFIINDTLSDGSGTNRTVSKGRFPGSYVYPRVPLISLAENGVFGDAHILFINRRDGVPVEKQDEEGELLPGSSLQILDVSGEVVHEFTSTDKPAMIVGLAPGDYKLHEVSAPAGYLTAEDVSFTVESLEEVETVTMTDPKDPSAPVEEKPEEKVPATGDHALFLLPIAALMLSGAAVVIALDRRQNNG
ncbi:MAG: hypothetical protein IKF50_03215 [Clostridia bacterium]|nr:hypothetical protein [Clostridia bacterium]